MKPPTRELFVSLQEVVPTLGFDGAELDELVAPRFGLITGYPHLLEEISRLTALDLGELFPAVPLSGHIVR